MTMHQDAGMDSCLEKLVISQCCGLCSTATIKLSVHGAVNCDTMRVARPMQEDLESCDKN